MNEAINATILYVALLVLSAWIVTGHKWRSWWKNRKQ